jgi:hypothetical protein
MRELGIVEGEKITLRASRQLAVALGAGHALAMIIVLALVPWSWLKAGLTLALAWSAWHSLRMHALRLSMDAIVEFEPGTLKIRWRHRDGRWVEGSQGNGSRVATWFLLVHLTGANGGSRVVVARDALERDAFRRLSVWLRWRPRASDDIDRGRKFL